MQTQEQTQNTSEEISIEDIVKFLKEEYKKIILASLTGALAAIIYSLTLANYEAKLIYTNYTGIDIPRLKSLQVALPKLFEEIGDKQSSNAFLKSDSLWEKSVKANILIKKTDGKDLLDTNALIKASNSIPTIEIVGFGRTKEIAKNRVEILSQFFINGASYLQTRDLIRNYELKAISTESSVQKRLSTIEIEKNYLEKRIRNLNALKNQFPNAVVAGSQVVDAKDSGAKYLPISTQIIAATTDLNGLQEQLARLKDEEAQVKIYSQFVIIGKKLILSTTNSNELIEKLLNSIQDIQKTISTTDTIQINATEAIKVDLKSIQTDNLYGLRQIGEIDFTNPTYSKYIVSGLFGGLFFGFLLSFLSRIKTKFF